MHKDFTMDKCEALCAATAGCVIFDFNTVSWVWAWMNRTCFKTFQKCCSAVVAISCLFAALLFAVCCLLFAVCCIGCIGWFLIYARLVFRARPNHQTFSFPMSACFAHLVTSTPHATNAYVCTRTWKQCAEFRPLLSKKRFKVEAKEERESDVWLFSSKGSSMCKPGLWRQRALLEGCYAAISRVCKARDSWRECCLKQCCMQTLRLNR